MSCSPLHSTFGVLFSRPLNHAQNPRLLDEGTTERPDYQRCIAISTRAALKYMVPPGALVMLAPLVAGTFFGVMAVCGLLTGKRARGGTARERGGVVCSLVFFLRRRLGEWMDASWGRQKAKLLSMHEAHRVRLLSVVGFPPVRVAFGALIHDAKDDIKDGICRWLCSVPLCVVRCGRWGFRWRVRCSFIYFFAVLDGDGRIPLR